MGTSPFWLGMALPPEFSVWLMNRYGDLFVILPDGSIHMLDVGGGSLTRLAESRDDFARLSTRATTPRTG